MTQQFPARDRSGRRLDGQQEGIIPGRHHKRHAIRLLFHAAPARKTGSGRRAAFFLRRIPSYASEESRSPPAPSRSPSYGSQRRICADPDTEPPRSPSPCAGWAVPQPPQGRKPEIHILRPSALKKGSLYRRQSVDLHSSPFRPFTSALSSRRTPSLIFS